MTNLNPTEPKSERHWCSADCECQKTTPTTPQPDYLKEFDELFMKLHEETDGFECRAFFKEKCNCGLDEIKSFIKKVESESYERGKEEGYKELMKKIEGMKKREHGDTVMPNSHGLIIETLGEKRTYNQALNQVLKILKEGYKKGLEELNK